MDFTGSLDVPVIDFATGKLKIVIRANEDVREQYELLKDCEKLKVTIKKYHAGRSRNANNYFHVLVGKLANVHHTSAAFMKNLMLQRYGQLDYENGGLFTVTIRDDVDVMEREEIHVRPTEAVRTMDDGRLYRVYIVVRGSHTYDTAEMAHLIDGVVSECKESGIETLTPAELEQMKKQWKGKNEETA